MFSCVFFASACGASGGGAGASSDDAAVVEVGSTDADHATDPPPNDAAAHADTNASTDATPIDATDASAWFFRKVSGDGDVLVSEYPGTDPLRVLAIKGDGTLGVAVPIDWSVSKGNVVLTSLAAGAMTNSSGMAQVSLRGDAVPPGVSWTDATVTASATLPDGKHATLDFHVVTVTNNIPSTPVQPAVNMLAPDATTRDCGSGKVGDVIPHAIQFAVAAASGASTGQAIPGVGLRLLDPDDPTNGTPVAECVGGTVLSDEKGIVTCDLHLLQEAPAGRVTAMIGGFVTFDRIAIRIDH